MCFHMTRGLVLRKDPGGGGGGDILPNLYCTFYTIKEGTKGEDFLLTVYSLHLQPIRCKEGIGFDQWQPTALQTPQTQILRTVKIYNLISQAHTFHHY